MNARFEDEELPPRSCVVLAHPDTLYSARLCRAFRQYGWDVYVAGSAPEVYRRAQQLKPALVILATELGEESGWLVCDKLKRQQPDLRVFLVGSRLAGDSLPFADFVGAAGFFHQEDSITAIVDEALEQTA